MQMIVSEYSYFGALLRIKCKMVALSFHSYHIYKDSFLVQVSNRVSYCTEYNTNHNREISSYFTASQHCNIGEGMKINLSSYNYYIL